MKNPTKLRALCCMLGATMIISTSAAADCKTLDSQQSVAALQAQHEGSKVLKVEKAADAQGCDQLLVKILIDGTVQVITIPNSTGA